MSEQTFTFKCHNNQLCGIIHESSRLSKTGVVIVVGGPQYRVGSHRQFVLLARFLAEKGYPVMRFDYTGMGDSTGEKKAFDKINADIEAAINTFQNRIPSIKNILLWGLCDAASASLFYAPRDPRIIGLALLNPWVHTEAGEAKTFLRHYYKDRIFEGAFWKKLLQGRLDHTRTFKSIFTHVRQAFRSAKPTQSSGELTISLPNKMLTAFKKFQGKTLILLSDNDLTAREFDDLIKHNEPWQLTILEKGAEIIAIQNADHTFSNKKAKQEVEKFTHQFISALNRPLN
jgi:exosortase A-associated hydrolase 1